MPIWIDLDSLADGRRKPRHRTVYDPEEDPSRTVQSDRNLANIEKILAKYADVGIIDHMAQVDLEYRDVTEFEDFADVMRQAKDAEFQFLQLPPQVRAVFENKVEKWLDAAHDPEKLEALRPQLAELGLMDPLPEAERVEPEPASPPPDSGAA